MHLIALNEGGCPHFILNMVEVLSCYRENSLEIKKRIKTFSFIISLIRF